MNLASARVGDTVRVLKLHGEGPVRRRIMDMGITKGQEIFIRKVAPLGDPMEVTIRNYELSVRKADCEQIEVEVIDPETGEAVEEAGCPECAAEAAKAVEGGEE